MRWPWLQSSAALAGLVRFESSAGDYLALSGIPVQPAAAGFTVLWRARMTRDDLSVYPLRWRSSTFGATLASIGCVNAGSGNLIRLALSDEVNAPIVAGTFPGSAFRAADGVQTFLVAGSQAGGLIYLYRADALIASLPWGAGPIGFTDGGSGLGDIDECAVGRENNNTRSDQDLGRLTWWNTFHDITQEAVRRTLCGTDGVPVDPLPAGALVDLAPPAASVHVNAGSLGDFTVQGDGLVDV